MDTQNRTAAVKTADTHRNPQQVILGLILLIPAALACIGSLIVPTLGTIITSFQKASLLLPRQFVGMANYVGLFQDPFFSLALRFTLTMVGVRLLAVIVVPPLLAVAVGTFGRAVRGAARLLFTIPLVLFVPIGIALTWRLALVPHRGFLADTGLSWANPLTVRPLLLTIDMLVTLGLACGVGLVFCLMGLHDPADRAFSRQRALKALVACWLIGILAVVALTLQSFTLCYVLTGGGPSSSTTTLAILQYAHAFRYFSFGAGTAIAVLTLVPAMLLGLGAGLIVVLAGLRLEAAPPERPSPLIGKPVAAVLLVLTLFIGFGAWALGALPLPWTILSTLTSAPGAFRRLGEGWPAWMIPLGRAWGNTIFPALIGVLLVQLPIAYVGALGIGALRPLGKRSELLLLPFSPWLFVTLVPLSVAIFGNVRAAEKLNTSAALISPLWLSVPMLFILTLFFKGQAPRWRAARAEGRAVLSAFVTRLILPSLPLALLLVSVALFVGMQSLYQPLLMVSSEESYTMSLSLWASGSILMDLDALAVGITAFALPVALLFFLIWGALQIFYLSRLALSADTADQATE